MATVGPVFLDTSTLLRGLIEMGPSSAGSQSLMASIAARRVKPVQTAWHCCLEFYSVATRLPPELRLSPTMALQLVEEEILARFEVHELSVKERLPFLRVATADRIAGGRIYDAHIAEVARLAGARWIVTENRRHFIGLMHHGVRVATADEFLAEVLPE